MHVCVCLHTCVHACVGGRDFPRKKISPDQSHPTPGPGGTSLSSSRGAAGSARHPLLFPSKRLPSTFRAHPGHSRADGSSHTSWARGGFGRGAGPSRTCDWRGERERGKEGEPPSLPRPSWTRRSETGAGALGREGRLTSYLARRGGHREPRGTPVRCPAGSWLPTGG